MAGTHDMAEAATRSIARIVENGGPKLALGSSLAFLSSAFHWAITPSLFQAAFLVLVADWLTGTFKGFALRKANSDAGVRGVIKSLIYLLILALAWDFGKASPLFAPIDDTVAWMIIATEFLSILENLIEITDHFGISVPVLSQILAIVRRFLKEKTDAAIPAQDPPPASVTQQTEGEPTHAD